MNRPHATGRPWLLGALAVATLATAACSSVSLAARKPRPTVQPGEFGAPACFDSGLVREYRVLDSKNLVVFAPSWGAYHLHLIGSLEDLTSLNPIAFAAHGTRVCGHAGDQLLVGEDSHTGRYFISDVYVLDQPSLDALYRRFGIGKQPVAPDAKPVPTPPVDRELGKVGKK